MIYLAFFLAVLFLMSTVLPFLKLTKWYIRIFDFPRIQILVLGTVALLLFFTSPVASLEWVFIFFVFAGLVYHLKIIFPYTFLARKQVKPMITVKKDKQISILICNVYMNNKWNPTCLEKAKMCNADLLFFVETDLWWEEHLKELECSHPYTVKKPLGNTYGMLLYSKLPLIQPEVKYLVKRAVPSIHTKVELRDGTWVFVHLVHPEPPVPGLSKGSKPRDAELLIVGRDYVNSKMPVIVCGDLNDVAWSYTTKLFQKISQLLDPRVGRGLFSTYHAKYPFLRWPLDHVFHSSHFSLVQLKRLGYTGSDHFPIFVNLQYEDGKINAEDEKTADHDDRQEVREKIQAVK